VGFVKLWPVKIMPTDIYVVVTLHDSSMGNTR
jgi:hypothetical protein